MSNAFMRQLVTVSIINVRHNIFNKIIGLAPQQNYTNT